MYTNNMNHHIAYLNLLKDKKKTKIDRTASISTVANCNTSNVAAINSYGVNII